jgi:DNA gyrase subunit A
MGDFLNAKLEMDKDERPIFMHVQNEYPEGENMVFVFENGKGLRVPITAYAAKGNRRKLKNAFSTVSPIVGIFYEAEKHPFDILLLTDADRAIVFKTSLIPVMSTRHANGNTLMTFGRREKRVAEALSDFGARFGDAKGYHKYKLPATGVLLNEKNIDVMQLRMDD